MVKRNKCSDIYLHVDIWKGLITHQALDCVVLLLQALLLLDTVFSDMFDILFLVLLLPPLPNILLPIQVYRHSLAQ